MDNLILIIVLVVIVGLAVGYIYKAKKKGVKCIGCPDGCHCSSEGCGSCSGCSGHTENQ